MTLLSFTMPFRMFQLVHLFSVAGWSCGWSLSSMWMCIQTLWLFTVQRIAIETFLRTQCLHDPRRVPF